MNAFELKGTTPNGRTGVVWACGVCERVGTTKEIADECCAPVLCVACGDELQRDKPKSVIKGDYACVPCADLVSAEREEKRIAAAPRVPESEAAMLFCDCCEQFFSDSDELLDDHHRRERDLPEHAWACDPVTFSLDAQEMVTLELERQEFHEDTEFEKAQIDELQAHLDAWCSRYAKVNFFANNKIVDLTDAREQFLAVVKSDLAMEQAGGTSKARLAANRVEDDKAMLVDTEK